MSEDVTVFWFDQATTGITATGSYSIVGNSLTATGGNAVDYSVSARLRPMGLDCSVPQITNLRIGILQNLDSTTRANNWNTPTLTWNVGVAAGATVVVPTDIRLTLAVSTQTNDSEASVAPSTISRVRRGRSTPTPSNRRTAAPAPGPPRLVTRPRRQPRRRS